MLNQLVKKSLILALALPFAAQAQSQPSLEDRVAELEANASLNNFKFGGFLESYYDSYIYKNVGVEDKNSLVRMRAAFDINVDVSPKTKFYSRLSASKFMNQIGTQGVGPATSEGKQGRDWSGSQLYLEKAYADVAIGDSAFFSFGRLPTVDGPPANWNLDKPRMGTYPMLIYNTVLDGFAATYNVKFSDSDVMALRVIHTPLMTVNKGTAAGPSYYPSPSFDGRAESITQLTSWMADYTHSAGAFADKFNVIYQGVSSGDINIAGAALGGTGNTSFAIMSHTLNVFAENIAASNVDLGVSYLTTELKNKGAIAFGPATVYGFGAESREETVRGNTVLAHIRYNFANSSIGGEYLNGSKNVFLSDAGSTNLTNFYATPGDAHQVYVTHRFLPELTARLGYAQQNYKYNDVTVGATAESEKKITTYSALLRVDF